MEMMGNAVVDCYGTISLAALSGSPQGFLVCLCILLPAGLSVRQRPCWPLTRRAGHGNFYESFLFVSLSVSYPPLTLFLVVNPPGEGAQSHRGGSTGCFVAGPGQGSQEDGGGGCERSPCQEG